MRCFHFLHGVNNTLTLIHIGGYEAPSSESGAPLCVPVHLCVVRSVSQVPKRLSRPGPQCGLPPAIVETFPNLWSCYAGVLPDFKNSIWLMVIPKLSLDSWKLNTGITMIFLYDTCLEFLV